jgi:hypothetical protein
MSHLEKTPQAISISFGITQVDKTDTVQSLVKRADAAMYEAKNLGGDIIFKMDTKIRKLVGNDNVIQHGNNRASTGISIDSEDDFYTRERLSRIINTRKEKREKVKLVGRYVQIKSGKSGAIIVEDVSRGGIGFRTLTSHDIKPNDLLEIRLNLDEAGPRDNVISVVVRYALERRIGAEIYESNETKANVNFRVFRNQVSHLVEKRLKGK